jgi:hypothetical protein
MRVLTTNDGIMVCFPSIGKSISYQRGLELPGLVIGRVFYPRLRVDVLEFAVGCSCKAE